MADKKISALPAATTPLAGTEVLPLVQGGTTDQVTVANLTAGRAVSALSVTMPNTEGATSYTGSGATIGRGTAFLAGQAEIYTAGTRPLGIGTTGAGNLNFYTGSTRAFYVDTNQNFVVATANKGIDFSANANAPGMTSELLNDYEEGTWTPSDQSGAGLSLTVANATYTKIGRLVTANFAITYPATVNATNARIGGLPFTSSSVGFSQLMAVSFCQTGVCKSGLVDTSATTFLLLDTTGNALTNAQMSTLILRGTVIYEV